MDEAARAAGSAAGVALRPCFRRVVGVAPPTCRKAFTRL